MDEQTVLENETVDLVPAIGGGVIERTEPYPWDEEPIAVGNLLSNLNMDDLMELAPFYVTNIRYENTDFANAVERDGQKVVYLFDVLDGETQEFYGTAKSATRGIIKQIDDWIDYAVRTRHDTQDRARKRKYGPVSADKPMTKARADQPARQAKSVQFVPPRYTAHVVENAPEPLNNPATKRAKANAGN